MSVRTPTEAAAFKRFEADGWSARAHSYGLVTGRVTAEVGGALLDAAGVEKDMDVLDVACGPGHLSAAAARRGARPVGTDLSEGMLARARREHPELDFRSGDAEALPFRDERFDAVLAGFVFNHLPAPESAAAEGARVCRPGARLAVSVWDRPERTRLIGLLGEAVEAVGGDRDAGRPPGPDSFRFATDDELAALLSGAGLDDVRVETFTLSVAARDSEELWQGLLGGSVRASTAVLAHPPDVRNRIRAAFDELAAPFSQPGGGLAVPAVVKIGSGCRP
jgi:ubiquinone/menaquinone biosynthesis C-methylase UbiE